MHILRYDVGNWNSMKFTEEGLLQQNMDTRERLVEENPLLPSHTHTHIRGGHNRGLSTHFLNITQFLKVSFKICATIEILQKPD